MPPIPVALPLLMAVVVFYTPSKRWRPRLLAATAAVHFGVTVAILAGVTTEPAGSWLRLDAPGRLLLGVISLLVLASPSTRWRSFATASNAPIAASAPACWRPSAP